MQLIVVSLNINDECIAWAVFFFPLKHFRIDFLAKVNQFVVTVTKEVVRLTEEALNGQKVKYKQVV